MIFPKLLFVRAQEYAEEYFNFEIEKLYIAYFVGTQTYRGKAPVYKILSSKSQQIFGISDNDDYLSTEYWTKPKFLGSRHFKIIEIIL